MNVVELFMDQYLDSHISDVQVMFSLAFSLRKKFENGTLHCRFTKVYQGVVLGDARGGRGVFQKGWGEQLCITRWPFKSVCVVYMSVPINYL